MHRGYHCSHHVTSINCVAESQTKRPKSGKKGGAKGKQKPRMRYGLATRLLKLRHSEQQPPFRVALKNHQANKAKTQVVSEKKYREIVAVLTSAFVLSIFVASWCLEKSFTKSVVRYIQRHKMVLLELPDYVNKKEAKDANGNSDGKAAAGDAKASGGLLKPGVAVYARKEDEKVLQKKDEEVSELAIAA